MTLDELFDERQPTQRDQQLAELQESLTRERDKRKEDWFIFVVVTTILLDVVFFSVLDNLGGPLALIILQLLILIPLARRLGMEEIVQILDRLLNRIADKKMDE